jgi:hypothetical protein
MTNDSDDKPTGATMQIDVTDLEPPLPSDEPPRSRATPPPLPPSVVAPVAPPPDKRKVVVYGAIFVAFLAAAIFGGVKVGLALRSAPPAAAPSVSQGPTTAPAVISIPTVEFTGPPVDAAP